MVSPAYRIIALSQACTTRKARSAKLINISCREPQMSNLFYFVVV